MKVFELIKKHGLGSLWRYFDSKYGIGRLEYLLNINWFNPFLTLWVNIRSFPLNQAVHMPFWVYGRPRFYGLSGQMEIRGSVKCGQVKFNKVRPGAPSLMSSQSELYNLGKIVFSGDNIVVGCGNKIFVERKAVLTLGGNLKIQDMTNIGCLRSITIGSMTRLSHRCQVMDSNYHFLANFNKKIVSDRTNPIVIGHGCWIGNSTTIMPGVIMPDYTIVSGCSLVNKSSNNIPGNSIIGGIPARLIASRFRKIENVDYENVVRRYYRDNTETYVMSDDVTMEQCSTLK